MLSARVFFVGCAVVFLAGCASEAPTKAPKKSTAPTEVADEDDVTAATPGPTGSTAEKPTETMLTDPHTDAYETLREGSRLRARYTTRTVRGAEGARHVSRSFVGWYDAERKESCSETLAADGKLRCYPSFDRVSYYRFSNSSCTRENIAQLGKRSCGGAQPTYVLGASPKNDDACVATGLVLRKVGARVTRMYDKNQYTGACEPMSVTLDDSSWEYYELSDTIAPSDFVELAVESTTTRTL